MSESGGGLRRVLSRLGQIAGAALLSALAAGVLAYAHGCLLMLLLPDLSEPIGETWFAYVIPCAVVVAFILGAILAAGRSQRAPVRPVLAITAIAVVVTIVLGLARRFGSVFSTGWVVLLTGMVVSSLILPVAAAATVTSLLARRRARRDGST